MNAPDPAAAPPLGQASRGVFDAIAVFSAVVASVADMLSKPGSQSALALIAIAGLLYLVWRMTDRQLRQQRAELLENQRLNQELRGQIDALEDSLREAMIDIATYAGAHRVGRIERDPRTLHLMYIRAPRPVPTRDGEWPGPWRSNRERPGPAKG